MIHHVGSMPGSRTKNRVLDPCEVLRKYALLGSKARV